MTDEQLNEPEETGESEEAVEVVAETTDPVAGEESVPPQYGVGPFSIREVVLVGVWLVAFVVSFFPLTATISGSVFTFTLTWAPVWAAGISWILTIGVPTIAVFLIVLRRFSPQGIRRVGSLGIDQFASVAFSVSALVWLGWVWETIALVAQTGEWVRSWVIWVEVVLMLIGVVLTVLGPVIPPFSEDFAHRREIPAHRSARPLRPVTQRPVRVAAPVRSSPEGVEVTPAAEGDVVATTVEDAEVTTTQVAAEPAAERQQAFWALVPEERDIVDETGIPLFRIGPTAWALVIEDHGSFFIVRHEDGRVGYLRDVTDVTRG